MIALWLRGLITNRPLRLLGAALGVALTTTLVACLGTFLAASNRAMTARAVAGVPIDWQVRLGPGMAPATAAAAVRKAAKATEIATVDYARVAGFTAATGGTIQTTGPGQLVGLPAGYQAAFPAEIRLLRGAQTGVLIAQQTASNLQVGPGDTVTVRRMDGSTATVTVTGVVDLPDADAFFQAIGVPKTAVPQAPPDNVLLAPAATWHHLFAGAAGSMPGTAWTELHVRLDHTTLPAAPDIAYNTVTHAANNVEARLAGAAQIGNTLAARLDAVRGDALYARVLFLFLGVPGTVLAIILTLAVTWSGGARRRHEQALLRARGATVRDAMRLAGAETVAVGSAGVGIGLAATAVAGPFVLGAAPWQPQALAWSALAAMVGLALAGTGILWPTWREARQVRVAAIGDTARTASRPVWQRAGLDFLCLAAAGAIYWQTAANGYQVVLAPEGVAAASVDYKAFAAPLLFWIGSALLTVRLLGWLLGRRERLAAPLRPVAGPLAPLAAGALSRQRRRVVLGSGMIALAVSFAVSTAIFNACYRNQAQVDATLTNGADVTVTGTAATPAGARLADLRAVPGVAAAEPMMHRYAYVGSDLQDLFGIDPARIGRATRLADAYFAGGNAAATLARLAATPDGVLVSEETVKDFQLNPGDRINLRLLSMADHQYHVVPFHFVGVAREFPTAPKDSFLVANEAYIAAQTGSGAAEIVLIRTDRDPAAVAAAVRNRLGGTSGLKVTDLHAVRAQIASSLISVDLAGLTAIELGFAVIATLAAAGLIQALGFADRRRTFALLDALGASRREIGAFVWNEALFVLITGLVIGVLVGTTVAAMLVALLTGVFDPPPEALIVPWGYITLVVAAAAGAVATSARMTQLIAGIGNLSRLRDA